MSEAPSKRCLGCGYILDRLPESRCPECGRPFDPDDPRTWQSARASGRPLLLLAIASVLLAALGPTLGILLGSVDMLMDQTVGDVADVVIASSFSAGITLMGTACLKCIWFLRLPSYRVERRAEAVAGLAPPVGCVLAALATLRAGYEHRRRANAQTKHRSSWRRGVESARRRAVGLPALPVPA